MDYNLLLNQIKELIFGYDNLIGNLANVSSAIYWAMENTNWVGFYFLDNNKLILGPFQGKPACMEIPFGKGVCGTCVKEKKTIVVDDVHTFSGHIACDSASNSEIVIPIIKNNQVVAVLDIDSEKFSRFSHSDSRGLEKIVEFLQDNLF